MTSLDELRATLPALLTKRETAGLLRASEATLDRLSRAGSFPAPARFGGALLRWDRDEVLSFLAASKGTAPMPARQPKAARAKPLVRRRGA